MQRTSKSQYNFEKEQQSWREPIREIRNKPLDMWTRILLSNKEEWTTDIHCFPGSSVVKNPPANSGDTGESLGREDPLERAMATHSSILAWEIPWTEKPGGLQSKGSQRVRQDWAIEQALMLISTFMSCPSMFLLAIFSSWFWPTFPDFSDVWSFFITCWIL